MVSELMAELDHRVRSELKKPVQIEDCEKFPNAPDDLYLEKRIWKRINQVVVVAADLAGSTKLNFDKKANTSASLYEALTGNLARVVTEFGPEFLDIQGDGLFALFHGERRFQRAFCAAVTLKTFSERVLVPAIEGIMSERFPNLGLKVGMDASTLVAKRVGVRGGNEPVWAGRAVGWAVKCLEAAAIHELVATKAVFQWLESNEYVVYSCGCPSGTPKYLWSDARVESLPEAEGSQCKRLKSSWCTTHGDEFCQAIRDGKTRRQDLPLKVT